MSERAFTEESFQQFMREGKLVGSRSKKTGELYVPPRPICPKTFSAEMEWVELSGKGELAAFTAVHIGPTAMVEAGYDRFNPYCSGIVKLIEGPSISAQILGVDASKPESIAIGTPLRVQFIQRGEEEEQRTYLAFAVDET
jgi:uncharacterized OB-fold protein